MIATITGMAMLMNRLITRATASIMITIMIMATRMATATTMRPPTSASGSGSAPC